jgi:uncharacterized protein (TIGR04255 family)
MPKRYRNPPIIEVLCEFQFDEGAPWDLTLIGLIYDKLKDSFPNKQQLQLDLAIATATQTIQQIGNVPMIPLVRFLDSDEKKLIQIGQNLLTVNHIKPYESWENFSPFIKKGLDTYYEIANPKGFRHVALKYFNRIEVPKSYADLESLFRFRPLIPSGLPQDIKAFLMGVNLPYEDAKDTLHIQVGTVNSDTPDMLVTILEITYLFANPGEIAFKDIVKVLNKAHKHIEDAFEFCLTDELKQTFGEVKE